MLGGAYYIWIMLGFFLLAASVMFILAAVFLIGHWINKKETGETHGFLELPHNLRPGNGEVAPGDGAKRVE